jgi:hypothetical protein
MEDCSDSTGRNYYSVGSIYSSVEINHVKDLSDFSENCTGKDSTAISAEIYYFLLQAKWDWVWNESLMGMERIRNGT